MIFVPSVAFQNKVERCSVKIKRDFSYPEWQLGGKRKCGQLWTIIEWTKAYVLASRFIATVF